MDGKIKEIIENEMDCLITDVDFVIKKEGSLQALVNMLEAAINYTRCCTELKCEGCKKPLNDGLCGSCCTDLASGMY